MNNVDDLLVIGCVTTVYGVKGWVKIKSFTQPQQNFLEYQNGFIKLKGQWQPLTIESGREHGKGLVAKFKGFDDRTAAEALIKAEIAIERENLPDLEADEYYWHQLEGLVVETIGGFNLGRVSHLLETGSNDVLVVKATSESLDQKERLLPYRPEVVQKVDLQEQKIWVDWDPEF